MPNICKLLLAYCGWSITQPELAIGARPPDGQINEGIAIRARETQHVKAPAVLKMHWHL